MTNVFLQLSLNTRAVFSSFLRISGSTKVIRCRRLAYDVAVVGGGAMGSSSAYFLAQKHPGLKICVIERDFTYAKCSTSLSIGSIRQQFSTPENIKLSQFGYNFLSDIKDYLGVDGHDPPDVNFRKGAYFILAGENGAQIIKENHEIQRELGCKVSILTKDVLEAKYPWLNTDGVAMASLGTDCEGWFDPWSLLTCFKKKAVSLGVDYINAETTDIHLGKGQLITSVEIAPHSSPGSTQRIHCGTLVNATGCWSGRVSRMLGIHLPIEPRKRYVYVVDCPNFAAVNVLLCDTNGVYIRPEGTGFVTGRCPLPEDEPEVDDLEVDYDYFNEHVWPALAHRIPAFECLKVQGAWAGYYEYNVLDQNSVIGRHPEITNLIFASGFSGHGIQHSPGTGRAVSELILDQGYTTIDLTRLGYERIMKNEPLIERNVI